MGEGIPLINERGMPELVKEKKALLVTTCSDKIDELESSRALIKRAKKAGIEEKIPKLIQQRLERAQSH